MLKTQQIMLRPFYNKQIRQRTSDSFFNATDLLEIYNKDTKGKKELSNFLRGSKLAGFLEALANDINKDAISSDLHILPKDLYTSKKGVNGGTWMHPYLFMKFAMWINPVFEVQVIKWIYDNLILFRHNAGDNFKEMMAALQTRLLKDGINQNPLEYKNEINFINKLVFGAAATNQRKRASEEQLRKLSQLQKANIKLLEKGFAKDVRWEQLRDFSQLL